MSDNTFAGWPAQTETVTIDGLDVDVTLEPDGTVTAQPVPVKPNTTKTVERESGTVRISVGDDKIYVNSDGPLHFHIPCDDDGTIPRAIGHRSLPMWLMKELRSLGFQYE